MATLKAPKSISKRSELRKDTAVTIFVQIQEFIHQNRTLAYGIAGAAVLVLLAIVGYVYVQSQRGVEAQDLLGGIVLVYEQGRYQEALDGTGDNPGLLVIAEDYGGSEAGNMARFYAADALFRLGEYDQALEYFEAFDKGNHIVGASALAGEAAIYETKEDYARAGALYRRAALQYEDGLTSPEYLHASGRAYEKAEQYEDAHNAYQMIRDRFPESAQAQGLDYYLARVAAKIK